MLTSNKFILSISEEKTKKQLLDLISKNIVDNGELKTKTPLLNAFLAREEEFSTGIGEGIAIPHAEVEGLAKPIVTVVRVKNIDWGSIDNKPVETIVAIAVPKGGRGDHLAILAELSKKMVNEEFLKIIKKGSKKDVVELINSVSLEKEEEIESDSNDGEKYIVGITACPTGIAHTFMAQQKIIDAAKAKGYRVKVETQGSEGQKDALTNEDIHNSDAIIISTGIALDGMERFNGYEGKIHTSELQNTIANAPQVIDDALEVAKNFKPSEGLKRSGEASSLNFEQKKSKFEAGMGHIMTGITAMIPILLIAGLLMAIGNIGALPWTLENQNSIGDLAYATADYNVWVNLMYYINQIGSIVMKFMYPIFAMYLAYSIGGKLALIPGLMGGVLAAGLESNFMPSDIYSSPLLAWAYPNGFIPSMFFGAMFIGAFAGLMTRWLNQKIQFSPNLITLKTMLIIPLIMSITVFLTMAFIVNPFFGQVNYLLQVGFESAGTSGTFLYQLSIAAGTAFDLGGPINKAAGAVANGLNTDSFQQLTDALATGDAASIDSAVAGIKTFNITGRTLGIIIPPIGIGCAAIFGNTITRREIFTKEEQQLGGQAMFLGAIGISEGAIPMMIKYPAYVICADIIGAMAGTTVAVIFGSIQTLPLPAIWGWFLVGTTTQGAAAYGVAGIGSQMFGYILGVFVGVAVVATIFTSFLLVGDIKQDKANKVFTNKQYDSIEDEASKAEAKDKSIESLNKIIEYHMNELNSFGGDAKAKFDKLSSEEITELKVSFSKLKVSLGKEMSKLAKLNYLIMRNGQKSRVADAKIEHLKDEQKIAKINDLKFRFEEENKLTEEKIKDEKQKISSYINSQVYIFEELKKQIERR